MELKLPYKYYPRDYQRGVWEAMTYWKKKRMVCVWHRRAGKDLTGINIMVNAMVQKVGVYYYLTPTYAQGKKIIWDGIHDAMKFIDHFPKEMIRSKNNSEMKIELVNGSLFQVIGTDNVDTLVGTNPVGCIFSEYSLQDPLAFKLIRPILVENGGWALFLYTPRGHNHGYDLYEMAKESEDWFCERLTVEDTKAISVEDIERERREGMDDELVNQEYYCGFEGFLQGSYYANQLRDAEKEGRICTIPHEKNLQVNTYWDLGVGDATAIWFMQQVGKELRFIDYYEMSGEGLPYYVKYLKSKPYNYGRHYAPHDIRVRELGSGRSREETARSLGLPFQVISKIAIDDGIHALRLIFNRLWFDKTKCKDGLNALRQYHKEFDDKRGEFKSKPFHDWSSHASDALRGFAVGHRDRIDRERRQFYQSKRKQKA